MKVELIIPSNLSEISLKQYQKFLKIQETNDDSYFLQCKMIEIFCNLDAKSARLLKLTDADRIVEIMSVRCLVPDIKSQIICLVGPPGVGKSTGATYIFSQLKMNNFDIQVKPQVLCTIM